MSLNKVMLIGNVGTDPQLKEFGNGGAVCNMTIATTDRAWKTKDGKEVGEKTEWHNVIFHNQLAKVANQYLKKGDKVYIEGKLTTRSYEKDGQKRYVTEISVSSFEFMQKTKGNGTNSTAQAEPVTTQEDDDGFPFPF